VLRARPALPASRRCPPCVPMAHRSCYPAPNRQSIMLRPRRPLQPRGALTQRCPVGVAVATPTGHRSCCGDNGRPDNVIVDHPEWHIPAAVRHQRAIGCCGGKIARLSRIFRKRLFRRARKSGFGRGLGFGGGARLETRVPVVRPVAAPHRLAVSHPLAAGAIRRQGPSGDGCRPGGGCFWQAGAAGQAGASGGRVPPGGRGPPGGR
jgi:hypothetical protein